MNTNSTTQTSSGPGCKAVRIALGVAMALGCALASAQTFHNGSFNSGKNAPTGGFVNLPTGSRAIDGWVVSSGNIDWIATYWKASDGKHSLDLSGLQAGSVSQTFATQAGRTYRVLFDLAGNPVGAPEVKRMKVTLNGGQPKLFEFSVKGHSTEHMGWVPKVYVFRATKSRSKLTFASLSNSDCGPALSHVRVVPVEAGSGGGRGHRR